MVCNKCYETTKNDNLLYGLRLTEINFINEEISAQQLHIISIFECKNQYRECVLSILNYVPHFTRHKIKNATDFVKKYHQNLDHISNIYFNKITSFISPVIEYHITCTISCAEMMLKKQYLVVFEGEHILHRQ